MDTKSVSVEEAKWLEHATNFYAEKIEPRFTEIRTEEAIGVDWTGGIGEFVYAPDREYPNWPKWMFGTADLVCWDEATRTVYVGDWKTGGTDGAEEQLLSLLYGAVKGFEHMGYPRPEFLIISCLKVSEDGVWPQERLVSADELAAHAQAMEWQWEELQKITYKPKPGVHCTSLYCPHLSYCGEIADIIDTVAERDQKLPAEYLVRKNRISGEPSNGEEAAYTMERLSAAKRQLNYLIECMKVYVRNGGVIVSGKWQWSEGKDGFRWRKVKD